MKAVPRREIKRLKETEKNQAILMLELCRESNEDLWKRLILLYLENLKMLKGTEGEKLKNEIRRKFI